MEEEMMTPAYFQLISDELSEIQRALPADKDASLYDEDDSFSDKDASLADKDASLADEDDSFSDEDASLAEEVEVMTPAYFRLISEELYKIQRALPADEDRNQMGISLIREDVTFLEKFCMYLETWKYNIDEENEESMERLTSVITSLKVIWPKDFTLLSPFLKQTGDTDPINTCIPDLVAAIFELEGLILQSKSQIEGWCLNSIHSTMMMPCKPSNFPQIFHFIRQIQDILMHFLGYKAQKHIEFLRAKIEFLKGYLLKVVHCPDGKEISEITNFIGNFANNVARIAFSYWAKGKDHEITSEMNNVLFDMLHKFIPCAYDITPLYVGFLKANDLQLASDSFRLEEAVESFVDLFFEHLATVLKDDFLFLRDRLMFLFTFFTDPPCENAEEGDLIRSQIHAILREDVYLLMSFDEMNEDFSENKALLSGFMTRIDIVNAKIRQLYYGSSDSWITLEVEKTEYNYIVSVHRELSYLEKCAWWDAIAQIQLYKMELRLLRVFLLWLGTWDDTDEEIKVKLRSIITSFRGIWGEKEAEGLLAHRLHAIREGDFVALGLADWDPLAFELQGKIQQSKLETKAWCLNLFHSSLQFKTSTCYKILEFMDSMLDNLNDLVRYKASEIIPLKKQIDTLEEKLLFLKNFLKLAVNCKYCEELGKFKLFVQAFANDAAWLGFLYWTKGANAESASETNSILSHMLQTIKPATPDVARLYFGTLMAIYVQRSDSHMFGQTAFSFVDLFREDLVTHLKDDDFDILQDNIVFLLTFLNDPPNQNAADSICSQIDVLFWEGLYGLIPFDDIEGGFSKKKVLLSDFMMKIEAINANIRSNYGKFPDTSLYNFPKVISPQFLDFLLQNLRNLKDRMNSDRKYAPFAKYKIIKIEEELASLCPFFIHIFDLKSELKETWLEVVNVLHLTEHVIMSCISSSFVFDHPIWYHMAYLSDVFDEIKVVKAKLEMIKLENIMNNEKIANSPSLPSSDGFISELAEHDSPSEINEIVVGFEHEAEEIIGMLTRGPKSLDIVSIVGMGGLGKTTLAKKIYGSSSVKSEFHVFAFCSVSLDHNTTRLLLDVIRDIKGDDYEIHDMTNDGLAHKLRKCLSHQKYLIVLDDIWNVSAWNEVKSSFPDHENGSRVMFTTRSLEVADKCRIHCSPHQLRFLSEVESWELLQKKVFRNGISPPYLYEIGKRIAENCKGLALAVVVIGGLLAKTEESLRSWSKVATQLRHYLSDEGCMGILDLSYKHLPENLKTCLIYLGAFPEDMTIEVKRVIRLWIAEGFVQETKTKSLEDVAKGYFQDLVDRSFIIVGIRSSSGGIKAFRVHDLILDLCRTKCRDGNFFQLNHESASSSSSINNHYRVSTRKENDVIIAAGSSLSNARTLHYFPENSDSLVSKLPLRKLGPVQVLDLGIKWEGNEKNQLTSLIHLRYLDAFLKTKSAPYFMPSSISNLWNLTSLKLSLHQGSAIHLPETFWRMKSLRYVKVFNCILKFPDDDNLSSDQIMDKVVNFSKPVFSTRKDVERLLQRLPAVRRLSCFLEKTGESIETFDFYRELESLTLCQHDEGQYMIKFPSTLKKLTWQEFRPTSTVLSAIADLHCLQVLKLRQASFVEPILEMEDLVFRNLKFFELDARNLKEWNASTESLPCLEQLVIKCETLKELPSCFGEMPTLKRIVLEYYRTAESSALRIQEELMELGIQLEVSIRS